MYKCKISRLNHIEDYLNENKPNPGSQRYRSLEREAEKWVEEQQQQEPQQ